MTIDPTCSRVVSSTERQQMMTALEEHPLRGAAWPRELPRQRRQYLLQLLATWKITGRYGCSAGMPCTCWTIPAR